jgi:hypothetical protein
LNPWFLSFSVSDLGSKQQPSADISVLMDFRYAFRVCQAVLYRNRYFVTTRSIYMH